MEKEMNLLPFPALATAEQLNGLLSIWDGWEHQIVGAMNDGEEFGYCAMGWLLKDMPLKSMHEIEEANRPRLLAVGRWLEQCKCECDLGHMPGVGFEGLDGAIRRIIYANDKWNLSPDDFRDIDRMCQLGISPPPELIGDDETFSEMFLVDTADMESDEELIPA